MDRPAPDAHVSTHVAIQHPDEMETQVSDHTVAELEALANEARLALHCSAIDPKPTKKILPPVPWFIAAPPADSPEGQRSKN